MHVVLDRVEGHDLLHVEGLRHITGLERRVHHARITEHHLWGGATRDKVLWLLLLLIVWRGHRRDRCLLLRRLT